MGLDSHSERAVAIVTGGSSPMGRAVALSLARGRWSIVIVYLDQQALVEATVEEIVAVGGTTVAVRADLADDLDVERLFTESIAAFGDVEVVVDTTAEKLDVLCAHAARYVRQGGLIVTPLTAKAVPAKIGAALRERGITVRRVPPEALTASLDPWP
jgi:NAD(P)-dependent dehydrogenase (short-subunit alcohol dehydrogenase family)